MKRVIISCLLPLLFLSGCHAPFSLPRATEPRNQALVSVWGVDKEGETVTVLSATQGRGGTPPETFHGSGGNLAAARLSSRDQGTKNLSYAHVEDIVVSETAAGEYLSELLSYSFQNGEQSMESHLWMLRDATLDELFSLEMDWAQRLSVLKTGGETGTSLPGCTLRQAAARLLDDDTLLLPALRLQEGELIFDGYALLRGGAPVGFIEGELARSVSVLAGNPAYWTGEIKTDTGLYAAVQLHSFGCSVKPTFQGETLSGLSITCQVEGQLMELWSASQVSDLNFQVKSLVERELHQAVGLLQDFNTDASGLRRQAGLRSPFRWGDIEAQWDSVFPTLPVSVTVVAKLTATS